MDERMYKIIMTRTQEMEAAALEVKQLFRDDRSYSKLISKQSSQRGRLNQIAFEICVEKNYQDIAMIFIEKESITVTWEMVKKMLASD